MVQYLGVYDIMNSSFRKKTLAVIVICLMMLMSLPMVMADGNQKEIRDNIVETESYNGETHTPFATVAMDSEPILKADISSILGPFDVRFSAKNIGDATAHNVTLSSTSFEGNVLYNNRKNYGVDDVGDCGADRSAAGSRNRCGCRAARRAGCGRS